VKRDYYEILEVTRTASEADIKKAYRRLARKYHPDVNTHDEQAEAKFKEVAEAYEVLNSPEKRRMYDQFGHAGARGGGGPGGPGFGGGFGQGFGFEDIFEVFFDGFGGGGRRRSPAEAGSDMGVRMKINFEEAAFGVEREIEIVRPVVCEECHGTGAEAGTDPATCPMCGGRGVTAHTQSTILGSFSRTVVCSNCNGTGQVITHPCGRCQGDGRQSKHEKVQINVPAGVADGVRLKLSGRGAAGRRGGPAGDLYVDISVKPHPVFTRVGNDVTVKLPISFSQAALGTELLISTLDGEEKLHIPPGTQTGTEFRLRGHGIPYLNRRGRGDQVVETVVKTPQRLNEEQRRLLEDLSEHDDMESEHRGIINRIKEAFGK
jgi:molecular chaperone DnaJ